MIWRLLLAVSQDFFLSRGGWVSYLGFVWVVEMIVVAWMRLCLLVVCLLCPWNFPAFPLDSLLQQFLFAQHDCYLTEGQIV